MEFGASICSFLLVLWQIMLGNSEKREKTKQKTPYFVQQVLKNKKRKKNKHTHLNLSCPAVSHICNLIFCPETSIILVPNSTPIVWGQSAITENHRWHKTHK